MKKYIYILSAIFIIAIVTSNNLQAASITRGYSFTTNESVTSTKLHLLVDGATVSAITSSDIQDGTISLSDMGANSVDTSKVVDGSLTGADMLARTITTTLYGTNSVDGTALATNITFNPGFLTFSGATPIFGTNQVLSVYVSGATNTTGVAMAGKVVKLNDSGLLSSSITPFSSSFTSTNLAITAAGALTVPHGLSGSPNLIQLRLKCNSADLSYSVNDEVICDPSTGSGVGNYGVSIVPDASNINVRYGSQANTFFIPDKTTGNAGNITDAKWYLIIRAWY